MSKKNFNTKAKDGSPKQLGYAVLKHLTDWRVYNKKELLSLIERGADLTVRDDLRRCASLEFFRHFSMSEMVEVFEAMIAHGLPLEAKKFCGMTPLMECVRQGKKEYVEALIRHKANVNAVDNNGKTCLMYAADWASLKILNQLIDTGADYTARDNDGKTAYDYALAKNKTQLMKALKDAPKVLEKRKQKLWAERHQYVMDVIDCGVQKNIKVKPFKGFKNVSVRP